ncbi:MAG: FAD-dependent oxidoreductase [Lachnospiraceae bacterium]
MQEFFTTSTQVKKKTDFDVIVAGGGMAGCSAALAAARNGSKVLLIEKLINLGGLATSGMVIFYFPSLCTVAGKKIMGGLAEELLHVSIKYGHNTLHPDWKFGTEAVDEGIPYATMFSVPSFIVALDEALEEAGVTILFDSVCVDSIFEDGSCKGVIVENKEGRVFYGCKALVDATGDVDLFHRTGAECLENDKNYLSYWTQFITMDRMKDALETDDIRKAVRYGEFGVGMEGRNYDGSTERIAREYSIETGEEVSEFVFEGRRFLRKVLQDMDTTKEMAMVVPNQAQYRTTRQIVGNYTLNNSDINKHFEDSIGYITSFDDIGEQLLEIPYSTLVTSSHKNMLTAGRTISAIAKVREATRLIGSSAVTGEAAGLAASIAVQKGIDVNDVSVPELQEALTKGGVKIHFEDEQLLVLQRNVQQDVKH